MPTMLSIEINSQLTQLGSSRIYLYCSTSILFVWKPIRELQSKHIYIQSKIKKPRTILVLPELKNIYTVRLSAPNARCPFCILGGTSKRALLISPCFRMVYGSSPAYIYLPEENIYCVYKNCSRETVLKSELLTS